MTGKSGDLRWQHAFIAQHRVARLATVDSESQPHVVSIVYAFDGDRLYTPLDAKPKRVEARQLRRVCNILVNPRVAVLIDDYSEDWYQLTWVQVRGRASLVEGGLQHTAGVRLLVEKYPQYETMPLDHHPLIVIVPDRISGWRASEHDW